MNNFIHQNFLSVYLQYKQRICITFYFLLSNFTTTVKRLTAYRFKVYHNFVKQLSILISNPFFKTQQLYNNFCFITMHFVDNDRNKHKTKVGLFLMSCVVVSTFSVVCFTTCKQFSLRSYLLLAHVTTLNYNLE